MYTVCDSRLGKEIRGDEEERICHRKIVRKIERKRDEGRKKNVTSARRSEPTDERRRETFSPSDGETWGVRR